MRTLEKIALSVMTTMILGSGPGAAEAKSLSDAYRDAMKFQSNNSTDVALPPDARASVHAAVRGHREDLVGRFIDSDGDGVPNADDPAPRDRCVAETCGDMTYGEQSACSTEQAECHDSCDYSFHIFRTFYDLFSLSTYKDLTYVDCGCVSDDEKEVCRNLVRVTKHYKKEWCPQFFGDWEDRDFNCYYADLIDCNCLTGRIERFTCRMKKQECRRAAAMSEVEEMADLEQGAAERISYDVEDYRW